jgi:hypothetical protein
VQRVGRRNSYHVQDAASFRHPVVRDNEIGALLSALGPAEA